MSDTLTPYDEDDVLAAEYVIGLLDAPARQAAQQRARTDTAFATRIAVWEAHLEDLNTDYGTQTPPKKVKVQIDHRLFGAPKRSRFAWFSMGLVTAVLILGVVLFQNIRPFDPDLQARLESDETQYVFNVAVDEGRNEINLAILTGDAPVDGVFELWLIPAGGTPLSLGTFSSDEALAVRPDIALTANATLAIRLEPTGGSPTGAPTGPVVAIGVLENA